MSRIDQLVVTEIIDFSKHPGTDMLFAGFGFGRPPENAEADPGPVMKTMPGCFDESIAMLARGLGLRVDEIISELAFATSDHDITVAAGLIRAGTVAGMRHEWTAMAGGRPAIVFRSNWKMADGLSPHFCDGANRYEVELIGEPSTKLTIEPIGTATGDPGYPGRIWTGMAVVNMIPETITAPPGMRNHFDLGVGQPRGLFHEGKTWRPAAL
jgi:hypothetical protein